MPTDGSAASQAAPESIHLIRVATFSAETFPPPRGMSPVRITSTNRLAWPAPRCTMPVFIRPSYDII
jgi:hypothetical protein